ncbi:MAG: DUF4190 domain-containing protein [Anaerolineaceae bacterium]|nr:DUF4190 domain-containing protein [Anaerolineaceae bacterium]
MSDEIKNVSLKPNSTLSVVSLVFGIASFIVLPVVAAIAALITGSMAKKEIAESDGALGGEDLAKIGVILGWVNIGLAVLGGLFALCLMLGIMLPMFSFLIFNQ